VTFSTGARHAPDGAEPEAIGRLLPPPVRVYLAPGLLYASAGAAQVTTILGSCVAVCLWDSEGRVGGMNHFLLPEGGPPSPRFGESAVPLFL
jgi:chemotaxis protein CheD